MLTRCAATDDTAVHTRSRQAVASVPPQVDHAGSLVDPLSLGWGGQKSIPQTNHTVALGVRELLGAPGHNVARPARAVPAHAGVLVDREHADPADSGLAAESQGSTLSDPQAQTPTQACACSCNPLHRLHLFLHRERGSRKQIGTYQTHLSARRIKTAKISCKL